MRRWTCTSVFLIIFFCKPISSFAQEKNIEILKKNEKWISNNYKVLDSLFEVALNQNDTLQIYSYAEFLIKKAKKENEPAHCVKAHHLLSTTHRLFNRYKKSLIHIEKAINCLKKTETYQKKDRIYLNKGAIHQNLGEYELALDSYLKGLTLIDDNKDKNANVIRISFYSNIATLKSLLGDPEGAIEVHNKNVELIKKEKNKTFKEIQRVKTLAGMALAYIELENYDKALEYCHEIINNNISSDIDVVRTEAYIGLGKIYSLAGYYDKALYYLKKAQETHSGRNQSYLDVIIHLIKARSLYFLDKYEEVIDELDTVQAIVNDYKYDNFHVEEMYILYAKSYHKLNNTNEAFDYLEKSTAVVKQNNIRKASLNNSLLKKYDLNALEKELNATKLRVIGQKKWIIIVLIVLLVILTSSIAVHLRIKRINKKKFDALIQKIEKNALRSKNSVKKGPSPKIEDKKIQELLGKLQSFEEQEEYMDKEITLRFLSKKLNTNSTYLSNVINTYKRKSFSMYLSDLRIEKVLEKLRNENRFRAYKIQSIADEMGFNNVNTFSRVFKKKTGIYPSYFIKQLNKKGKES